jgi:hypothetical protein
MARAPLTSLPKRHRCPPFLDAVRRGLEDVSTNFRGYQRTFLDGRYSWSEALSGSDWLRLNVGLGLIESTYLANPRTPSHRKHAYFLMRVIAKRDKMSDVVPLFQ